MSLVGPARRTQQELDAAAAARREQAELIAAVARGDQDAFAELYDQIVGRVHAVVLVVLRDPAQAEEVTQEVMVELWRTAARFDPERGSVRTWAATLAHRRAVDRVRSAQAARQREEADQLRSGSLTSSTDEVAEGLEAEEERTQLVVALRSLTDTQRESIRLAYFGGHAYREVATILDAPEGTVKTRIRDGLTKLRSIMEVDDA